MSETSLQVLVVDDSVVFRRILQNVVAEIPGAEVVGIAANGRIALEKLKQLNVDVVLLDVEMPELDGIETLKQIRKGWPEIGVVLLSGADRRAADITMTALALGALDFVPKADTGDAQRNQRQLVTQLNAIVRAFVVARNLSQAERSSLHTRASTPSGVSVHERNGNTPIAERKIKSERVVEETRPSVTSAFAQKLSEGSGIPEGPVEKNVSVGGSSNTAVSLKQSIDVLLIGSSTGGPQALAKLIPGLAADLGIPVLVVQHMPPVFTASLAENLNRVSKLRVSEASDFQMILPNQVFVAPGGRHMVVRGELSSSEKRIALTDDPPVNSVRPAVDVLFASAAQVFGGNTLSVILTGMGEDGREGVRALRVRGGITLTQSAGSCVVYGMPRAVVQAGLSDESVPLDDLALRVSSLVRKMNVSKCQ
jgi:two-component system chemotaxis response regulator CheB